MGKSQFFKFNILKENFVQNIKHQNFKIQSIHFNKNGILKIIYCIRV